MKTRNIKKINDLKQNENIRDLCRGLNEVKKHYQPRSNLEKDEYCDLLADSYGLLNRWKNYFCQLLNVCGIQLSQ